MTRTELVSALRATSSNLQKIGQWVPTSGQVRIVALNQKPEEAIQKATNYMERMGTPEAKAKVQEFLNHIDPEIANAHKDLCTNRRYKNEAEAKQAIVEFLAQYNPWLEAVKMRMFEDDFEIVSSASLV